MCYQLFRKESVLFTPKNTLLERILATLLANYEEDSLDGDSFVSQSRFDAYASLRRSSSNCRKYSNKRRPRASAVLFVWILKQPPP